MVVSFVVRLSMSEEDKELLDSAVKVSNRKLANFIVTAAVNAAKSLIS